MQGRRHEFHILYIVFSLVYAPFNALKGGGGGYSKNSQNLKKVGVYDPPSSHGGAAPGGWVTPSLTTYKTVVLKTRSVNAALYFANRTVMIHDNEM